MNPNADTPDDRFNQTRLMVDMKQALNEDTIESKEYIEVMLKGGNPNKKLEQYLANDRKVLSFHVLWDDTSYDGGEKFYTLNYFLADSTMEVKEIKVKNSGIDPFPMLLNRMAVPKEPVLQHCPGLSLKKETIYQPEDLLLGRTIKIYNRDVLLVDCDDFTKNWYRSTLGHQQVPLKPAAGRVTLVHHKLAPYNGYGSEEDSAGSCKALNPKAPRKDVNKLLKNDMHILRFNCKLVSPEPDDENRVFTLSFFCGDDTIMVYELCDKNSGRIGGKFMER